ncbi:MAG: hypothetical protein EA398_08810 [Deltaproteobacteria bacterium]|nr:MAG: hypothetical protein EA398_08810 [Deltaproteobacteria bacterium]
MRGVVGGRSPFGWAVAVAATLLVGLGPVGEARANPVTVPVNIGVGPTFYNITGPVARDQPWHFGLRLRVQAVLDQETIRANAGRIPARYRSMAMQLDEARISPFFWLPDALILSPKVDGTSIYGATWRPISVGVPLIGNPVRFRLGAGALLTYAWIDSETLDARTTHFLRPGIDLEADLEIPFARSFLINLGWSSRFYVPQEVGGRIDAAPGLDGTPMDNAIWHWGMAYVMLNIRFPYTVNL